MSLDLVYRPDFRCDDAEPLQAALNELYDYGTDLETKVLHRCRLNLFHGLLAELESRGALAAKEAALDIGCNAGVYSKMISDRGYRLVEGVDIEGWMIERARAAFGIESAERTRRFRTENAEELSGEQRYDFVLCTEVIEHTARPERVLAQIRTRLRPGGVAVVSLPNACSLPFVKAALKYRLTKRARDPVFEDHLRYPFWRSLSLFPAADFERLTVTGTNLFWDATTLRWFYGRPAFEGLNRMQFALARRAPLACVAQFFFMALRRRG